MKVSVNWIRQLVDFELLPVDELVAKIGAQLGELESVEDLGEKYQGIIVAKVAECEKHPNADKLSLCKIDDGGRAQNVERDENGLVQVVCGAPNVRKDLLVAWLPPGSTVPSSLGSDPFVLEARDLRGKTSNGMLASAKELAISDNHEGILEIDKDAKPGDDFAELYKLNDYVIDIENKMFTHRPDCFGALGVAREIAGILGRKFKSPDWYLLDQVDIPPTAEQTLPLEVENEIPKLVPRFMATPMANVEIKPSPVWLQVALAKLGQKPINNVVDLTNFYMLLTSQPTHAYDYDKLRGHKLAARLAKKGEKVKLLNGKTYELTEDDIVITDGEGPVGLAGIMGGSDSEVDENTKNIVVECANFDMYCVRRSSMRHGVFTDALTRFNKGQSPLQNRVVLAKLVEDLGELSGAKVAGHTADEHGELSSPEPITISADFINDRLGLKLNPEEISKLLENVEFDAHPEDGDNICALAPFWRMDIEEPEDIVEEVGRLYGYDKLPLELPTRTIKPASKNKLLENKAKIRSELAKAGANEVLTYSFVHGELLDKVGQDKNNAFQLSNALSPDLQYYRLSLLPSLLEKVHSNIKAGYDEFALFEIGKAHVVDEPDPFESDIPKEVNALSFVYAAKKSGRGAAYYVARKYLANLLHNFQAASLAKLEPLAGTDLYKNPWLEQMTASFEPGRSAVLHDISKGADTSGLIWGVVGEFKTSVRRALKLPESCAGFELDPLLFMRAGRASDYIELPKYPKVEQDMSLKVASDVSYQNLAELLEASLEKIKPEHTLATLEPLSIYQKQQSDKFKQIAFRLNIASYEKTMVASEVNKLLDELALAVNKKFGASRV